MKHTYCKIKYIYNFTIFILLVCFLSGCSLNFTSENTQEPMEVDNANSNNSQSPAITPSDKEIETDISEKSYEQVLKDASSFNLQFTNSIYNYSISKAYTSTSILRLKMAKNQPVAVLLKDNIKDQKNVIEKTINYYNDILSTINKNYKLQIVDSILDVSLTDTIIYLEDKKFDNKAGQTHYELVYPHNNDKNNIFIKSAIISIDLENHLINNSIDNSMLSNTLLHEFAHAFGLNDVYASGEFKNTNTFDMTTMLQTKGLYQWELHPNDYKILQALYSGEYKKHTKYNDTVNAVNRKIELFTNHFFETLSLDILDNKKTKSLTLKEAQTPMSWENDDKFNPNYTYNFKITSGSNCTLTIMDRNGKNVEVISGKAFFAKGILFVYDMYIKDAEIYSPNYKGLSLRLSFYFARYIDENVNRIEFKDFIGRWTSVE